MCSTAISAEGSLDKRSTVLELWFQAEFPWRRWHNGASLLAARICLAATPMLSAARLGPCSGRDVALYVDDAIWRWQGLQWAHLLADDIDELHRFASALGINLLSYQGPPRTSVPHYDVTAYERRRAIARGAIACSRDEIVAVLRRARSNCRCPRESDNGRICTGNPIHDGTPCN
jgi:hypothetical protein